MVIALAGGATWCLWHARRIELTDAPGRPAERRRWILGGLVFTVLAIGLAYLASDEEDPEPNE
jgi:hypothetical protein